MPISVAFWFDPATDAKVRAIWRQFAETGISSQMLDSGFRPHITLAAYDGTEAGDLVDLLRGCTVSCSRFPLELYFLGQFLKPAGTIFLAPIVTSTVLRLRSMVVDAFASAGRVPGDRQYDADRWVPHVTLGTGLAMRELSAAFEVCKTLPLPFSASVDRLGLVDHETAAEIGEIHLI